LAARDQIRGGERGACILHACLAVVIDINDMYVSLSIDSTTAPVVRHYMDWFKSFQGQHCLLEFLANHHALKILKLTDFFLFLLLNDRSYVRCSHVFHLL